MRRRGGVLQCAAAGAVVALSAATACSNAPSDTGATTQAPPPSDVATTATGATPSDGPDAPVVVDAPGVSDDEIRFASITTTTGNPLGTNFGNAYNDGLRAYFAWRNDAGGVHGRQLVLDPVLDDQLGSNAERAQAVVSNDDVFGVFVATLLFTGAETLDAAGVPTFGWGIHPEFAGRRNLFGHIAPTCNDCPSRVLPYIADQLDRHRIGVVAYGTTENSRRCGEGHRASIEAYGDDAGGLEVAYFDTSLPFGLPAGLGPQVSAMRDAGVDMIWACLDLNGMKVLGEELARQGLHDIVMHHPNSYDAAFVAANAELFEGDLVGLTFTPFEAEIDSEVQDAFFEWTDRIGVAREELTMIGWLNAHLAVTGLEAAGPDFNRAAVVDAVRAMEDYSADGMVSPIDWGTQIEHPGEHPEASGRLQCGVAVRITAGAFEAWGGEPGAPWFCWERSDDAYGPPFFRGPDD